ncbi:MAG TPA: TadE/TadG family type IV pilus assembly protein [Burkholderiaceae bacterium]|nr:TadE/TadG family type IV pilus assembly protein [Burkholderiaceae bacterium]
MSRAARARRQRGIAAVEFALILPVFLVLLVLPLFMGRVLWHYTAAQKAAHDAVRYLASASAQDMKDAARASYVVDMAHSIAAAETAELNPGPGSIVITPMCDGTACDGLALPATVTVTVRIRVDDIFFPNATMDMLGSSSMLLTANATYPYVGL